MYAAYTHHGRNLVRIRLIIFTYLPRSHSWAARMSSFVWAMVTVVLNRSLLNILNASAICLDSSEEPQFDAMDTFAINFDRAESRMSELSGVAVEIDEYRDKDGMPYDKQGVWDSGKYRLSQA